MATYLEIRSLFNDGDLRNRVEVAVVKAAQAKADEATPTDEELAFAQRVFASPRQWAEMGDY